MSGWAAGISPEFIVAVIVGVIIALGRFTTLLDRFKNQSAAEAAAELVIADRKAERQAATITELRAAKIKLERESLAPILEQLTTNAKLQAEVLDRLIHHNGSFKHMEEAMSEIVEGLKLLTGFIASLHDLPVSQPTRKGSG